MKKILFLLCTFVASLFCSVFPCDVTAKAETEDYVADSYLIEISETESMLPVPNIPEAWTYSITLKSGETVLGEGVSKYLFTQAGDYTLVYKLYKNGNVNDVLIETAALLVEDSESPVITIHGYDEEYYVGDELTVQTAQVKDNVDANLTATAELYLGEKKLSLQNGKFVFKKAGEYTLVYKAVDSYGNESELKCSFTVLKTALSGGQIALIIGAASVVVLGGAACLLIIMKKTQNKNKK